MANRAKVYNVGMCDWVLWIESPESYHRATAPPLVHILINNFIGTKNMGIDYRALDFY